LSRPTTSLTSITISAVICAVGLFGQSQPQAPLLAFEAVSIKPNDLGAGQSNSHGSPGRLTASMTTKKLIEQAFGVRDSQVSGGPAWLDQVNYDFVAKTPTPVDLNRKTLEPYFQSLLADRFHFKYHRETKEFPVYFLVTSKNGPKLSPHAGEAGESSHSSGTKEKVIMTDTNVSMESLANFLDSELERPVIDKTGLRGGFDFRMEWSPDQTSDSTVPSIFTALQEQLGLRLESGKGPVEILVIESIEQPSEN